MDTLPLVTSYVQTQIEELVSQARVAREHFGAGHPTVGQLLEQSASLHAELAFARACAEVMGNQVAARAAA